MQIKNDFLDLKQSLIQTIGRASKNVNGQVLVYADEMTDSIKNSVDLTNKRWKIQLAYNKNIISNLNPHIVH